MKLLFVDPKSSTPYDREIMHTEGIGGTEGSLVRVAHGLAQRHRVVVAQLGRSVPAEIDGVSYVPLGDAPFPESHPDGVIILRKHKLIPGYRRHYPRANLYCWLHNWQPMEVMLKRIWLARAQASVVTVSRTHQQMTDAIHNGIIARLFSALAFAPQHIPIHCIYNPIDEDLVPDDTPVDPDQLVFLSTANKGLNQVLRNFSKVRERIPSIRLLVAGASGEALRRNHGNCVRLAEQPGVQLLGRLPQRDMLALVRRSLCVFYPQAVHPETFGLVFAEANAAGTPVLAHDFGSAREILGGDEQLVDARNPDAVAERIVMWHRGGRPRVSVNPAFRTPAVVEQWERLLTQAGSSASR